jgi:hypothetical protein
LCPSHANPEKILIELLLPLWHQDAKKEKERCQVSLEDLLIRGCRVVILSITRPITAGTVMRALSRCRRGATRIHWRVHWGDVKGPKVLLKTVPINMGYAPPMIWSGARWSRRAVRLTMRLSKKELLVVMDGPSLCISSILFLVNVNVHAHHNTLEPI